MRTTASKWSVQLESSVDGCGRFFTIDCANLSNFNSHGRGLPGRQFLRDHNSGRYTLIDQQNAIPANTMLLTIPDDEADWVKDMVKGNCVTAIRRRNCHTGDVQHFCAVTLTSLNMDLVASSGVNGQDGVNLLSVPIEYFGVVNFNEKMEFVYTPTDTSQDMFAPYHALSPLAITGCGCQDCGEDDEIVYRYYYVDDRIDTLANDFYYLERSLDKGQTWDHVVTESHRGFGDDIPAYDLEFGFMGCRNGRLSIGLNRDNFETLGGYDVFIWTKEKDCDEWTNTFTEVLGRDFGGRLVDYTSTGVEAIIRSAPNTSSILIRTIRDGQWMTVFNSGNELHSIASAGSVIVAGGSDGKLVWSTENGKFETWYESHSSFNIDGDIRHIEAYLPNPLKRREAIAVISTSTGRVYRVNLPRTDTDLACTYDTTELPFDNAITGLTICSERDFCQLNALDAVDSLTNEVDMSIALDGRFLFWGRMIDGVLYYTDINCNALLSETIDIQNGLLGENNLKIYICKSTPSQAILA